MEDEILIRLGADDLRDMAESFLVDARRGGLHRVADLKEAVPRRVEPEAVLQSRLLLGRDVRLLADLVVLRYLMLDASNTHPVSLMLDAWKLIPLAVYWMHGNSSR